ncbi:MAG: catalase [Gemmatimonadales bacterium]
MSTPKRPEVPPPPMTTAVGAPVVDDQHSQTAGPLGPVLIQDHHLLEKLAQFNRERIPERVVHAKGSGAFGHFEVTRDVSHLTKAHFLGAVGKRTEVFVRFSQVAREKGTADTHRDPRGFAVKFYTEEGNYDLVGNNTPVFFIRDPLKFPDFIHSQKRDPYTNRHEPDAIWDFFSLSPEATHQFVWLFGDRGIPGTFRHMDGFGSHTFQWMNAAGAAVWVKYHIKTDQGIQCLTSAEAARIGGEAPDFHHLDLLQTIDAGTPPSWTVSIQVMTAAEADAYRFDPFDVTKVWPFGDHPKQEVGRLTLDRNPDNYFADVEQAAFDPAHFVPGIGPSPDKMLQGRLFAYGDAARYRLGTNHTALPVNRPHACEMRSYGRDGAMRFDENGGGSPNYGPNSRGGPVQSGVPYTPGLVVKGTAAPHAPVRRREDDDFVQGGNLYRLMDAEAQVRLVANIAASLGQVTRAEVIERSVGHFRAADAHLGEQLEAALAAAKA